MTSAFSRLGVPSSLDAVLAERGITIPTAIQSATLADSLAGRDVLGRGPTGSGKTYAFLLPLVTRLAASGTTRRARSPRALILAPTRELVGQIEAALKPLAATAGLRTLTVFGGVGQNPQVQGLRNGVDIVLACPGRLEDLIKQKACSLAEVEITILDEADHMADLGFLPAVKRLLDQTRRDAQRLLFSATLDSGVDVLVKRYLRSPVTHQTDGADQAAPVIAHHVLHLPKEQRVPVLADLASAPGRTVVFTRTKHGAKALARQLNGRGVPTVELHGNLSQNARTRNMDAFHAGRAQTLVATDIAARGIHVDDVALVVHADPPAEHKAYLHRSGRTARAGNEGIVVTLMTDAQVSDVRSLTRAAKITAATTRVNGTDHPILRELAPGERTLVAGGLAPSGPEEQDVAPGASRGGGGGGRRRRPASGRGAQPGQAGAPAGRPSGGRRGQGGGASRSEPAGEGSRPGGSRRRRPSGSAGSAPAAAAAPSRQGGHSASDFSGRRRGR
ncbi:DEAD/DEAH box helicase [Auraticoccus monumenti]|uniref:Superfamily II DNA and RNA helicase n=1 Tax=Auraticoccus monumenti TaxID=675864 RepID=A0A1G6WJR1_9ACTN|nr:DEAD/DEAH box helicase [Auraticoccus monumenti]SDD66200.1 Superfamily II DNA and RNA helicase [Auraticoccus monumenti]